MKKKDILRIVLELLFLFVFNLSFFVLSKVPRPTSVWISYGFIHLAYLMVLATQFFYRKNGPAVLGLSLYAVSSVYFIAEFIIGLLLILISPQRAKAALLIQILIAAIYTAVLIISLLANEHTADNLARQKAETDYIKTASGRVKLLMDRLDNKNVNQEIERVYDMLHTCPVKSSNPAADLEQSISDRITLLESAVRANDTSGAASLCAELQVLIRERNQVVQMNC